MDRNALPWAIVAFVVVGVLTPFELLSVPLAPLAALIIGAGAGWFLASAHRARAAGSGARAGAIVGLGALLGSIVGLAVLALFVGNIPEIQTFVQNSEPHPEARIPADWVAPLGALAGLIVGFVVGVFDLALSALAGWIAGAVYGANHAAQA